MKEVKEVSMYWESQLLRCAESVIEQLGYKIIDERDSEDTMYRIYIVEKVED